MTTATRTLGMDEVYTRVVKLLMSRAARRGDRLEAALTQAEIGERVGATREMVGRILRDSRAADTSRCRAAALQSCADCPSAGRVRPASAVSAR